MTSFDERISAKFRNVVRRREDMHLYQDEARDFLYENKFSALFIDMGLGKTVTSLTVIADLLSEFAYEKVLIIAPRRVATETWPTEIGLWEHTAHLNYSLIHVTDDDPRVLAVPVAHRTAKLNELRKAAAHSSASIHIISRDWIDWLVTLYKRKWPYRCVIVDESSSFKDHKTARFKALKKVRSAGLIDRIHLLTATPATETAEHLFAQIYLLDAGERFGSAITHFRQEYFIENKYTRRLKLRAGAENEILELIKDITLVMRVEDYLPIEKPIFVERKIHLSDSEAKLYRQLEKDFVVKLDGGVEIEAATAAALYSKLLQLASGVLYESRLDVTDTNEVKKKTRVHHIHDHKIDLLREIVDEAQGEPLLVAYHFKSSLERLKKAFPKATVMDRDGKCVKLWNERKIPMLFIHPQSGGHGLNMQKGGHNLIFFDIHPSRELFEQLIGRLARQGQEHLVVVQLLIAAFTKDEEVYSVLKDKGDMQEMMLRTLKKMIRRYRVARQESRTTA